MNLGLCDGDVYILLITLLPNGMGDDGVEKRSENSQSKGTKRGNRVRG